MNRFAWRMSAALVAVALTMLAGCRSHTAPTDVITGTWRGTIQDDVLGAGTIEMTMTWRVLSAAGHWSSTFEGGRTVGGGLDAFMNGPVLTLFMSTNEPPWSCGVSKSLAMNATLNGTTLAGDYLILTCDDTTHGSMSLTREP